MNTEQSVLFISLNRSENSTLEGREFPPVEVIDTVDEVIMTEKGNDRNRIIRYKPGEKSLFLDEQSGPYDKDGKIIKHGSIIFSNGILAVDKREVLLLKFLRMCNANYHSEHRMPNKTAYFAERNAIQEADEYLDQEKEDRALLNMIDGMEEDEIRAYALLLGDTRIDLKKVSELRRDLIVYAKNNPELFREKTKNVDLARKVHVIKAFKDGYVKYEKNTRTITWENGNEIVVCPIGKDPVDYLVELSFHPSYEKVYGSIQSRIPPEKLIIKANDREKNITHTGGIEEKDKEVKDLFEKAVKSGVIEKKGVYYGIKDVLKGEKYHTIGMGKNQTRLTIGRDKELKQLLEELTNVTDNG